MCGMTTQQLWLDDVGRIQNVLDMLLNTAPTAATVIDVPCTMAVPPAPWPPAPLDRVWSKHWDTVANKCYYHNAATGDSTWSLLQPSERPPPPPLPFGWIAEWDDTHGRYYYYNAETRTSVWVPPVPLPPLHPCHTKLPSATIKPCKCFPPQVPATGSCHKSQLQVRSTSADKCSAEQPEIPGCMERVDLLKDDRNLISKRTQRRPQVGEMREVEKTIASDGSRTWEMLGLPDTIATVEEDMPFVPFSGRSSSIQQEIGERLVAPEEMKKYELGDDLQPIINKLDPTSWHPEVPPIEPPTGKDCVYRQYWKQLDSPPQHQQSLKDPTILHAMD